MYDSTVPETANASTGISTQETAPASVAKFICPIWRLAIVVVPEESIVKSLEPVMELPG